MEPRSGVAQFTQYVLFPDRRDAVGGGALDELRARLDRIDVALIGRSPMAVATSPADPGDVLAVVASVDWHHPVLVVYRPGGDDRWSFARLTGRAPGEE